MAKPLVKINKTTFLNNYNIVEISNDINVIMKSLETFNPNKQAVMIGTKKEHKLSIDEKFDIIMNEIKDLKTRMNNLVVKNNLEQ